MVENYWTGNKGSKNRIEITGRVKKMAVDKEFNEMENGRSDCENQLLEYSIIRFMTEHNLTLSAAESCTGGLFSATLINVPGASAVFEAGFVTYSNKAKHKLLGVKKKTLEEYDAVSKETAKEMVKGTLKETGADYAVSITGLAGGNDGNVNEMFVQNNCNTEDGNCSEFSNRINSQEASAYNDNCQSDREPQEKPVGLVYIGCGRKKHVKVKEYLFSGNRTQIREASVQQAMIQLWEMLLKDFEK